MRPQAAKKTLGALQVDDRREQRSRQVDTTMKVAACSNLLLRERPGHSLPLRRGRERQEPLQNGHPPDPVAKIAGKSLHRGPGRTVIGANLGVVAPRIERFARHAELLVVQHCETGQKLRPRTILQRHRQLCPKHLRQRRPAPHRSMNLRQHQQRFIVRPLIPARVRQNRYGRGMRPQFTEEDGGCL